MMKGLWSFLRCVDPGFQDLQHEKFVTPDQPRVFRPTFKVTEAFLDHGRAGLAGRKRCQSRAANLAVFRPEQFPPPPLAAPSGAQGLQSRPLSLSGGPRS